MVRNNFIIQLPFFCGFYETPLYNSDMFDNAVSDTQELEFYRQLFGNAGITGEDLELDLKSYKRYMCDKFISNLFYRDEFPMYVKEISYYSLSYGDKLYARISFDDKWRESVIEFMDDNKDKVSELIHEDFGRDNAELSFIPDSIDEWKKEISGDSPDELYVSYIIKYIMLIENPLVSDELTDETSDYASYIYRFIYPKSDKGNV